MIKSLRQWRCFRQPIKQEFISILNLTDELKQKKNNRNFAENLDLFRINTHIRSERLSVVLVFTDYVDHLLFLTIIALRKM